ncbi:cytidine deaminase [bacterium]|nr:cytidine deaminase [bacterium]
MDLSAAQWEALLAVASSARSQAYAPYSSFAVGAAVLTADGAIHSGCNVENLSFGLTVCAERNAIASAVAGGMRPGGLQALVVVADTPKPVSPCGACRQVLMEFAAADCSVLGADLQGRTRCWKMAELLPDGFQAEL